jgi:hypothetical protein
MSTFVTDQDPIIVPTEVVEMIDAMIERQRRSDPTADLAFDEIGEGADEPALLEADPSLTIH